MSTDENKAVCLQWFDLTFTQHDLDAAGQLMSADFLEHFGSQDLRGRDAYTQFVSQFLAAFPDMRMTIDEAIAEADRVAFRVSWTGTHRGELMGIAPSGKQVTLHGMSVLRLADGKLAEGWAHEDMLALLQQLGAIPVPGQPA